VKLNIEIDTETIDRKLLELILNWPRIKRRVKINAEHISGNMFPDKGTNVQIRNHYRDLFCSINSCLSAMFGYNWQEDFIKDSEGELEQHRRVLE
tara:strand:- start:397 stop:681 length:285 start_codon:yes stop_codon:yes gene_type:complete